MNKTEKYFLPPPGKLNIKDLLKFASEHGVGRPVDRNGLPDRSWNPQLLADAITDNDPFGRVMGLRTVQSWFQENGIGVTSKNISKLAKVFGGGNPSRETTWRKYLNEGNELLKKQRNKLKDDLKSVKKTTNASKYAYKLLGSYDPVVIIALFYGYYVFFGLFVFFNNGHDVTYSPQLGLHKQVGFFWAPHWTILPLLLVPILIFEINSLLKWWKDDVYETLKVDLGLPVSPISWENQCARYSNAIWFISSVCFFYVFLAQWVGVLVKYIISGDSWNFAADWNILSTIRPDLISPLTTTIVSMFAYLYTALYMWIFLVGLLFVFIIVDDYKTKMLLARRLKNPGNEVVAQELGQRIVTSCLRISIVCIWFAICNRLHFSYLLSTSKNIFEWLWADIVSLFSSQTRSFDQLDNVHMNFFSTYVMLGIVLVTFCYTSFSTFSVMRKGVQELDNVRNSNGVELRVSWRNTTSSLVNFTVLFLLASGLVFIDMFVGFVMLLASCMVVSLLILARNSTTAKRLF